MRSRKRGSNFFTATWAPKPATSVPTSPTRTSSGRTRFPQEAPPTTSVRSKTPSRAADFPLLKWSKRPGPAHPPSEARTTAAVPTALAFAWRLRRIGKATSPPNSPRCSACSNPSPNRTVPAWPTPSSSQVAPPSRWPAVLTFRSRPVEATPRKSRPTERRSRTLNRCRAVSATT